MILTHDTLDKINHRSLRFLIGFFAVFVVSAFFILRMEDTAFQGQAIYTAMLFIAEATLLLSALSGIIWACTNMIGIPRLLNRQKQKNEAKSEARLNAIIGRLDTDERAYLREQLASNRATTPRQKVLRS